MMSPKYFYLTTKSKIFTLQYIAKWLLISGFIATLIGAAAAFFLITLEHATTFRLQHNWLILGLPLAGFLVALLYHYWGASANKGNNLLIDSIHNPEIKVPFLMAPLVYLGTMVTHIFGGSAGREGTALQMAGAIAAPFFKIFKLNAQDQTIAMIAAIAAGFSAVFGTPLAGTLFALEFFLIGKIRYQALFPALLSAVIAHIICLYLGVKHTHYQIPIIPNISFLNLIYALMVGVICGIVAAIFSTAMHYLSAFYTRHIPYAPLRPLLGGALVAALIFSFSAYTYTGLSIPTITASFQESLPFYTFALKIFFTVLTLSAGFKGGEVTPLFFIGATLGNALALFIPLPMALLAGMGFVAVFSGATNTPIACTLMAIELFGMQSGVYAAIACFTAYLCSGNTSIYQHQKIGNAKIPKQNQFENTIIKDL